MKTNQTIKSNQTMKSNLTMKTNKLLKLIPVLGIMALCTTQVQAQTTSTTSTNVSQTATAIKVVDNKGTIKYFQSNNGITQITSTTAGSATTTTWQLGGTLTDNTYIDVNGKVFTLNGLALESGSASTDATSESDSGTATGTGWTLLVRDEATGETKKMLASSLINGGVYEVVLTDDQAAGVFVTEAISGLTTVSNRISVFRNGVKLRQLSSGTEDWTLTSGTIDFTADSGTFYTGDVIEVQWVK